MIRYKKGSKLPYSDAKTAYGLLTDVIRAILEEPKRIWMENWLLDGDSAQTFCAARGKKAPACGTIGCISGWITTLKPARKVWSGCGEDIIAPATGDYDRRKIRLAASDMFFDTSVPAHYGTMKYARIVAGRIRKFQKEWAKDLKAVKV